MYTGEDGRAKPEHRFMFWSENQRDREFSNLTPDQQKLHYHSEKIVDVEVIKDAALAKLTAVEKFILGIA